MTWAPARAVSAIRTRLGNAGGAQEGPGFGRAHKVGARGDEAPGLRRGAGVEDEHAAGLLVGAEGEPRDERVPVGRDTGEKGD
jgi:hypothetical protein